MQHEGLIVKTTNGIAAAGLFMTAWLPAMQALSQGAALLVPILSAVWLSVQIVGALRKWWGKR